MGVFSLRGCSENGLKGHLVLGGVWFVAGQTKNLVSEYKKKIKQPLPKNIKPIKHLKAEISLSKVNYTI